MDANGPTQNYRWWTDSDLLHTVEKVAILAAFAAVFALAPRFGALLRAVGVDAAAVTSAAGLR